MRRPSLPHLARPGLRAGVLFVCSILVVAAAMGVSNTVSDHLATVAVDEAVASTQAVVAGFVDPMIGGSGLTSLSQGQASAIDDELTHLVSSGKILRIKVWTADGTVVASDLPALVGRQFEVDDDLGAAMGGQVVTGFS